MTELKILYDNYGKEKGYKFGWGFSAYIEHRGKRILFDFGEKWDALYQNMNLAGISPEDIGIAILSHDHWDHKGGLKGFMGKNSRASIYLPAGFEGAEVFDASSWEGRVDGRSVIFVRKAMEIADGVYTSGALNSDIGVREQALGIKTDKGIMAILGCSHPGVDVLVETLKEFGDIYGVIGGFHGFDRLEYLKQFELVIPTHCTQKRDEILELCGKHAVKAGAGFSLDL